MVATARDHGPERGEERQARNAQVIRPQTPDAGLVDERLADIENDGGDLQRDRSCQLIPPSG
jgi:hypothetical protein